MQIKIFNNFSFFIALFCLINLFFGISTLAQDSATYKTYKIAVCAKNKKTYKNLMKQFKIEKTNLTEVRVNEIMNDSFKNGDLISIAELERYLRENLEDLKENTNNSSNEFYKSPYTEDTTVINNKSKSKYGQNILKISYDLLNNKKEELKQENYSEEEIANLYLLYPYLREPSDSGFVKDFRDVCIPVGSYAYIQLNVKQDSNLIYRTTYNSNSTYTATSKKLNKFPYLAQQKQENYQSSNSNNKIKESDLIFSENAYIEE